MVEPDWTFSGCMRITCLFKIAPDDPHDFRPKKLLTDTNPALLEYRTQYKFRLETAFPARQYGHSTSTIHAQWLYCRLDMCIAKDRVGCRCVNSRIFISECGSLQRPARAAGDFCGEAWQLLAVVTAIRPPKAVGEPPAGAKCKPFHFVSGHSTQIFISAFDFVRRIVLSAVSSAPKNGRKIQSSSVCNYGCQLWHRII